MLSVGSTSTSLISLFVTFPRAFETPFSNFSQAVQMNALSMIKQCKRLHACITCHLVVMGRLRKEQRIFLLQQWWQHQKTHLVLDAFRLKFPDAALPARQTIFNLRTKFDNTGSTQDIKRKRTKSVCTAANMEIVAQGLVENPYSSIRRTSAELGISNTSVHRMLHDMNFRPFHPTLLQSLKASDYPIRLHYSELFLNQLSVEADLVDRILWTDEAIFKINGRVNRHNCVYWSTENLHETLEEELNVPGLCVWAGVWSFGIIGPFFIEGTVNAERYLNLLTNSIIPILQARPVYERMLWQQDGAPAHFSLTVRAFLDQHFPGRWIGRNGPIAWPPRSPDLTPMDYSIWGILKEKVFTRRPKSIPEMRQFIVEEFQLLSVELCQKICRSVPKRLQRCADVEGRQFQHL